MKFDAEVKVLPEVGLKVVSQRGLYYVALPVVAGLSETENRLKEVVSLAAAGRTLVVIALVDQEKRTDEKMDLS